MSKTCLFSLFIFTNLFVCYGTKLINEEIDIINVYTRMEGKAEGEPGMSL